MAAIQNLVVDQGASFSFRITVRDPLGSPLDLSLCLVRALIRRHPTAQNVVSFSQAVVGPSADGVLELTLESSETDAMASGRYLYDVMVTVFEDDTLLQAVGKYKILEGLITLNPTISRVIA
jgi:hypothetical protein